ncbi:TetR/AcrR family transcriptional regulator [Mucilaginibacter psychrotolerans]|uniref:TetR/AcrR family transcriptional regulator n=1 Tax=Mucilaginibacter psychrotolerans TaxID=1524096 RepID=A0A4Y8S423_9SPHI|nr:TetR/AcrR family transcriptional regulator [Mucilaginibacter psychrotolerans]TFF33320.1 TetR/AcrR family transcriptional regulator [Mucilaginibacter psychrotolerans]
MNFQLDFPLNQKLFLRDPFSTELGRLMVSKAIDLIAQLGFEEFNFKKLAVEINSTEASIYRYFQNKHRLLLYIVNWYWSYVEFILSIKLENVSDYKQQLNIIIELLTKVISVENANLHYNSSHLHRILVNESSKVFLVTDVTELNNFGAFAAYENVCAKIAEVIASRSPHYQYPKSFSATLVKA